MKNNLDYFDLSEHNYLQKIVFWLLAIAFTTAIFYSLLPLTESFFEHYLKGQVYNAGESMPYRADIKTQLQTTDYLTYWCIDIYLDTPQESRNWVNPLQALFFPSLLPGIILAFLVTTWLPRNLGLLKQKIERELASEIDKITLKVFGVHTSKQRQQIKEMILNADLRNIHDYTREWKIQTDEIISLRQGILWQESSNIKRVLKSISALSFFLKFYITKQYSNLILGSVYFGAAVLILVIGLRGIKFIPASEPSLVFFALGLEFCLLVIYAVIMMYGKEVEKERSDGKKVVEKLALSKDFGTDKEAENLLKVFILKDN